MNDAQEKLNKVTRLVNFQKDCFGEYYINNVYADVHGTIYGDVKKEIRGLVGGTINGKKWKFDETPKEKLQRLIYEHCYYTGNNEMREAFDEMENN